MAFSISSLTTEAGRSTTSPAAIWLARSSGSRLMRPIYHQPDFLNHTNSAALEITIKPMISQN